jgi:hypothetical protein
MGEIDGLTYLSLPALTYVFEMGVGGNPALQGISVPLLTQLPHGLASASNPRMVAFEFPLLVHTAEISIDYNAALPILSFPSLEKIDGRFSVSSNGALHEFSLPVLMSAFNLYLANNPVLPQCEPLAIKDRLVDAGTVIAWEVDGNDTTATCGPP